MENNKKILLFFGKTGGKGRTAKNAADSILGGNFKDDTNVCLGCILLRN
jgi:hypothetical protein